MILVSAGYQPQAADTSVEFEQVEFEGLRQRSPTQRLHMSLALRRRARQLSLAGLIQRFGPLEQVAFAQKVVIAWWQEEWPVEVLPGEDREMWLGDPLEILGVLHTLLGDLGIEYLVTGGMAAIVYGEPRTTRDIDVVVALDSAEIDGLAAALESAGFYVAGKDDVRAGRGGILQIIHQERLERADLIVAAGAFDLSRLARRRKLEVVPDQWVYVSTPEDVVLSKLLWRQDSGSEKQWRDVLGVLKVQG